VLRVDCKTAPCFPILSQHIFAHKPDQDSAKTPRPNLESWPILGHRPNLDENPTTSTPSGQYLVRNILVTFSFLALTRFQFMLFALNL